MRRCLSLFALTLMIMSVMPATTWAQSEAIQIFHVTRDKDLGTESPQLGDMSLALAPSSLDQDGVASITFRPRFSLTEAFGEGDLLQEALTEEGQELLRLYTLELEKTIVFGDGTEQTTEYDKPLAAPLRVTIPLPESLSQEPLAIARIDPDGAPVFLDADLAETHLSVTLDALQPLVISRDLDRQVARTASDTYPPRLGFLGITLLLASGYLALVKRFVRSRVLPHP